MAKQDTPQDASDDAAAQGETTGQNQPAKRAEMDWATLAAPVAMPTKLLAPSGTVNVIETVPEPIRVLAETSLNKNHAIVAAASANGVRAKRIDYRFDVQPVPNLAAAAELRDHLANYAKHRPTNITIPHAGEGVTPGQITIRTGDPGWYVTLPSGMAKSCSEGDDGAWAGLRYSARPFEKANQTSRLPGTAS